MTPRQRDAYNYKLAGHSAAKTAELMRVSKLRVYQLRRKAAKAKACRV